MNLCESITALLFCTILSAVYSSGTAFLTNATCGGVFTANNFYLQSPNYPQEYPRNLNCVYVLKGPNCPTHYQFDFIDFDLENSVGCVKDRLIIENQDALCGKAGLKGNKGYFGNNGSLNVRFISDGDGTARGFKILVTRLECENEAKREDSTTDITEVIDTTTVKPESTTTLFRPLHLPVPSPEDNLPQCCLNTFNSRRSIITSPNFPFTLNHKLDCKIKIQKATKNICRLKLSFLFFWLGSANHNSCPYGWLRVDGKFICGCNQDLKLTTTFEGENVKELVFRSEGVNLNSQSGFVIEVIQDNVQQNTIQDILKVYHFYIETISLIDRMDGNNIIK
ncbi:tolloid-like protein 1 [Diabrotica undecimpunctata]|uniref:tolloid-like protein 1 n=1 Tax=Diabrotica undecimpunctata TaxID=50387 RepID=UPI003B63CA84